MRQTALLFHFMILFLAAAPVVQSQSPNLKIISSESGEILDLENLDGLDLQSLSSANNDVARTTIERTLTDNGYLDGQFDSLSTGPKTIKVYVDEGCRYTIGDIQTQFALENGISNSSFDRLIATYTEEPFTGDVIENVTNQILADLERRGYYLAEVSVQSLRKLSADCEVFIGLEINPGEIIEVQGVRFEGLEVNEPEFIRNVAGIPSGSVLTPSLLQNGRQNLVNSGYFEEVSDGELIFVNGESTVLYEVEEQQLNFFDGLIGYQPDPAGSAVIAGYADILLRNTVADGNIIDLRYERLRPLVSTLNLSAEQQFIGGLPFEAGIGLNFIQQDSSYLIRDVSLQTGYRLLPGFEITASVRAQRSSVTETDQNAVAVDSRANFLGIGFHLRNTNRYWVPTRGIESRVLLERGRRFINSDRIQSDAGRSFTQTILTSSIRGYLPLGARQVLVPYVSAGFLESPVFLATDLFRFGGAESFRGFREDQFRASSVVWGELEARYMLQRNSYLFLFGSLGRYSRPQLLTEDTDQLAITETLSSLGFGLAFQSPLGIIKFSYAVSPNENVSNGNVHVGIRAGI